MAVRINLRIQKWQSGFISHLGVDLVEISLGRTSGRTLGRTLKRTPGRTPVRTSERTISRVLA